MHSFLKDGERILKERHLMYLRNLEKRYAVELTIKRQLQDTHTTVYGVQAGRKDHSEDITIRGIITADEFTPVTGALSSTLDQAFLYTTSELVKTADQIHIESDDSRTRIFKVVDKESMGSTIEVFFRYRLSALDAHGEEIRA